MLPTLILSAALGCGGTFGVQSDFASAPSSLVDSNRDATSDLKASFSSNILPTAIDGTYFNERGIIRLRFPLPASAMIEATVYGPGIRKPWHVNAGMLKAGRQDLWFKVAPGKMGQWRVELKGSRGDATQKLTVVINGAE
jgi:hypothetical protein